MKKLITLLEKELLEYRIVVKLPLFLALFAVLNFAFVMTGDNVSVSVQTSGNGIFNWSAGSDQFAGLIGKLNEIVAGVVYLVLFLIYVPKALRKEKQDGSLMFWRSMPVSDHLAIGAKLIFVLCLVPVITSILLLFSDFIVWLLASFFMPDDMVSSFNVTLLSMFIHWGSFIARVALMSLALFPLACGLLVISQLTRYPLLTVIIAVVMFKIAMYQATGNSELGNAMSDIYGLPFTILTSDSPLTAYFEFGLLSNLVLILAGVGLFFASAWLRGRDEMLKM
ncbi:ABC transporter [Photobacterium sanctipauli]|uniref:ABC transporter n=1 Tax=Photobacterium sanctipauli TaxID=1342794 RepID=A0A2T3NZ09_9GAMM|nr:ABC transporter [Photobacterium sanctipauli]PSW21449.1 ABC transporter [Photobacterium sanctipauli]